MARAPAAPRPGDSWNGRGRSHPLGPSGEALRGQTTVQWMVPGFLGCRFALLVMRHSCSVGLSLLVVLHGVHERVSVLTSGNAGVGMDASCMELGVNRVTVLVSRRAAAPRHAACGTGGSCGRVRLDWTGVADAKAREQSRVADALGRNEEIRSGRGNEEWKNYRAWLMGLSVAYGKVFGCGLWAVRVVCSWAWGSASLWCLRLCGQALEQQ